MKELNGVIFTLDNPLTHCVPIVRVVHDDIGTSI